MLCYKLDFSSCVSDLERFLQIQSHNYIDIIMHGHKIFDCGFKFGVHYCIDIVLRETALEYTV